MLNQKVGAPALLPGACSAFVEDIAFLSHVQEFKASEATFFSEFAKAWVELQQRGCEHSLREVL